ncbi:MAG: acyltransferase family protein [Leptolyngbyaceae cyanobacterium SM2_3_12]|nr:acyltransferase family protein [Leptolyngbyaceae cyanobacterium SM2_3_12]
MFFQAASAPDSTLTGWSLDDRDPAIIDRLLPFFGEVYHRYFRVTTEGWEHIPPSGRMLLVGSHNGGLAAPDTVMMTYDWIRHFGSNRPAYALMDPNMWRVFPAVARMATWVGSVQAQSTMAVQALRREAAVLIYPGGVRDVFRPHARRAQVCFFGQKGFIKLALRESAPVVPMISHGAHDTLWVLADLYPYLEEMHRRGLPWPWGLNPGTFPLYLGLPWGLALGPWPNIPFPVPLHTRVCAPIVFERYGLEAAHDLSYVEACYEQVCGIMQQELDDLFSRYD